MCNPRVSAEVRYASKGHVIFSLLYHTGVRREACRSLDVADWHPEEEYIEIQHKPDVSVSTPLKLQADGERNLPILDAGLSEAMDDPLSQNRIQHTGPDGREPLFTTNNGHISGTPFRQSSTE